jgi:hypothetical protein
MIVKDDTDYIEANGILPIGGEASTIKSAECQKADDEGFTLWDADWDAMLQANAGNGTVELGHYGKGLTITDGKSMNATFSGKWGDEGLAVAGEAEQPDKVSSAVEAAAQASATFGTESSLPTNYEDALASMTVPLGQSTAVISWVETRKASPTACVKGKKTKRSQHDDL